MTKPFGVYVNDLKVKIVPRVTRSPEVGATTVKDNVTVCAEALAGPETPPVMLGFMPVARDATILFQKVFLNG